MTLALTEQQRQAVANEPKQRLRLVDPKTQDVFVLLRADEFEQIRPLLDDDFELRDTYAAQMATAMRAGWADAAMDDYDNYDEAYRKLCQSSEAKSS